MTKQYSYPKDKVRILLLEGIHPAAVDIFKEAGYEARVVKSAMSNQELRDVIEPIHVLGIRSKTQIRQPAIGASKRLLAIGCFCIGTDQVDLDAAASKGVPVFNAPFSNTRSVAELTLAEVVMLSRKAAHRSMELHSGRWEKSAAGSREVRNKTIGIVGYGHIGSQVGLLAEAFGMRVVFYDIVNKLPLGNAVQLASLGELLQSSDFVTLHVPESPETRNMVSSREISLMKNGSCLLNLSRGSVVDLKAVSDALTSGHLAGAALDVFPREPGSSSEAFECELRGLENVILTPHIGGSTEEAQRNIGIEVASALVKYIETGSSSGSVNFPHVDLPLVRNRHRVLNIHRNVPGVLSNINRIVAEMGVNISSQYLGTRHDVGYLIMDVDQKISREVKREIDLLDTTIKTRLLF
ncbi:MAG: D-3-phosphoglycerate dehydrogenase [Acidobacteria bacterium]|jgi:D-3-phosphoglycerate dehydrogenase|nr:D-3-phosphoglycerate dehydrogenase [Acidobacteriota bacterium]